MKIYLASFMQKENFGPSGRIISITDGNKPRDIVVTEKFDPFIPSSEILDNYYRLRYTSSRDAGIYFKDAYQHQLEQAIKEIKEYAAQEQKSPIEILPFQDGDTLCSWERAQYNNYRVILAPFLEKLGYEVILN